jgi:hypothetical protein
MDPGVIGNFLVAIGLLLLPLFIAQQFVPGPYRLVRRLMRRLGDVAMFRQAQRRGFLFAICVHFFMIVGVLIVTLGLVTVTPGAVVSGVAFVVIAILSYRIFDALRRLRGRHRTLPTWRR